MVMISAGGELTAMMVVDLRSALPPQCSNLRIDRWLSGIFTEHAIRRSGVKRDRAAIVRGDFSDLRETRPLRSHVQWDAGRQSESVIIGGDGWRMIHQDPHSPARFQLHSAAGSPAGHGVARAERSSRPPNLRRRHPGDARHRLLLLAGLRRRKFCRARRRRRIAYRQRDNPAAGFTGRPRIDRVAAALRTRSSAAYLDSSWSSTCRTLAASSTLRNGLGSR